MALFDYWSQTALKPCHDELFKILKRIPQDMTFNQDAFREVTQKWPRGFRYSVDLTAATDRFPVDLITDLLGQAYPQW